MTPDRIENHDGYHPANLELQPYPHEAVIELAKLAKALGVQFKISGFPFGASYDKEEDGKTISDMAEAT
jgi:hypothetical protein